MLHRQVTYKVCFGAQPLPLVLVEKSLQEVAGGHRPAPRDLERLVQNVLIHLGHISAVEGRLVREGEKLGDHSCYGGHRSQGDLEQSWVAGKIQPDPSRAVPHVADWSETETSDFQHSGEGCWEGWKSLPTSVRRADLPGAPPIPSLLILLVHQS